MPELKPSYLTSIQSVLRKVTTFGAGLLIGTALIVIIPEGMESLFGEGGVYKIRQAIIY